MIDNNLIEQKVSVLIQSLESVVYEIIQNRESDTEQLKGIWHKNKDRIYKEREGLLGLLLEDFGLGNRNSNESQQGQVSVIGTLFFEKTEIAIEKFYQEKVKPIIYA